jgi:hypothetical protein
MRQTRPGPRWRSISRQSLKPSSSISSQVRRLALFLVLAVVAADARILGVFQGEIIRGPYQVGKGRWIQLQSRNGFVRKVEITSATVSYDEEYPQTERAADPAQGLMMYTMVRVTAEQAKSKKGDGAWNATEVLILPANAGTNRTRVTVSAGGR